MYLCCRETSCVEKHTEALVDLLSMCQRHPLAETGASVDPPHAKISSDLLSCLFTVSLCIFCLFLELCFV